MGTAVGRRAMAHQQATRLQAIEDREYAVVQSTVLVIAAAFVLVNFLTDLTYRWIDPRVREQ